VKRHAHVSTRQHGYRTLLEVPRCPSAPLGRGRLDSLDAVALVAGAHREHLLAVHRRRLPRADLEDCYSQATLELLARVRRGASFSSRSHIAHTLEQRLVSRVHDRRRALSGRSPIEFAIATALPLSECDAGGIEIQDQRADVERLVLQREHLSRIAAAIPVLSPDQRLVLTSQLGQTFDCAEFCRTHGWTAGKYRKVAQRARARLMRLTNEEISVESCPV
jgi:DNA-directed RNA polymerase specialized sigma24 family protein